MALTLFVDESGNTGGDLHEKVQPVFVHAGIWLHDDEAARLESELAQLHAQHRLQQPLPMLKGKTLVASGRGQKFVRDVFKLLRTRNTKLALAILDKPFVAAAVLLEDCCDYVYNDAFDVSWTAHPQKEPPSGSTRRWPSICLLPRGSHDEMAPKPCERRLNLCSECCD